MLAQNLDKLPDDAKRIIAWAFSYLVVQSSPCCMVEVRLDDPVRNLLDGGDGLLCHHGNGSDSHAKHKGDADWAIVHNAAPEWIAEQITPPDYDELGVLVERIISEDRRGGS